MKLRPCPFCEGPPVPIVVRGIGGGEFPDAELDTDDGLYVKAYVFCHECGAKGPSVEDFGVFARADCNKLERQAVMLWQDRHIKNRPLYNAGDMEGLNEYPREDDARCVSNTIET
jgi:hypothetical protein